MSPYSTTDVKRGVCFPRVSGDEPLVLKPARDLLSFSPRERG